MSFNDDGDEMGGVCWNRGSLLHSRPVRIPQKMFKDVAGRAQIAALPPSCKVNKLYAATRDNQRGETEGNGATAVSLVGNHRFWLHFGKSEGIVATNHTPLISHSFQLHIFLHSLEEYYHNLNIP